MKVFVLYFSSFFTPTGEKELNFNHVKVCSAMDKAKAYIDDTLVARGLTWADFDQPLDDDNYARSDKYRLYFKISEVEIDGVGTTILG